MSIKTPVFVVNVFYKHDKTLTLLILAFERNVI